MKSFVDWVLARRYRLIVLAAALAPLLQLVTMALIALETLRRGCAQALISAAIGTAGVLALSIVLGGSNTMLIGTVGVASFAAGIGLGALLRWAGALALAFQGTILVVVLAVLAVSAIGPGPEVLFAPVLDEMVGLLRENGATDQQIEAFHVAEPVVLGLLAAAILSQLLAALFLAHWWFGLASGDSRFGAEFRDLKLSRVLGLPASVLVTIGLVLDTPLVQNLTPLALFGFLFQGLSVMHAWAHAKHWHVGFIVPVYVLLVTPFVGLVVLGLSAVGLMDNWFDLRAPLRSRT